jgi:TolA-binding protein
MSNSTPTPTEQPGEHRGGFDLLEFWLLHRNMILLCAAALAAGLIGYATISVIGHQRESSAARMLAAAKSPAEMEALVKKYPKSKATADAMLMIAADHRQNQRFDAALAVLDDFGKRFPEHPFSAGALLSRGATLEAAGKREEALAAYEEAAMKTGSYAAPAAKLAKAVLLQAMGKSDEARQACEDLVAQDASSPFAPEAQRMLQLLQRM